MRCCWGEAPTADAVGISGEPQRRVPLAYAGLDLAPICQTLKRSVLDSGSGTLPHLPR